MAILPPIGIDSPNHINVIIEIEGNSSPVKYEFDKKTGMLFVDRFLHTSMIYPCNYGFIPSTLSNDGDPLDALVYSSFPIVAGAVINIRPIGVFIMEDESGQDEKIIGVPSEKIDPFLSDIKIYSDLPKLFLERVSHFFERYKDLEKDKWVKVKGWEGREKAYNIIAEAEKKYDEQ